jgi:AraC-like DNA-binding protein
MQYAVHKPPEAIKHYVEHFWTLQHGQEATGVAFKTFADGVSGMVFQHHNGRSAFGPATLLSGATHPFYDGTLPTLYVYGKITMPSQITANGPSEITGVVFKPQALSALFKLDAAEVTDSPVELTEFGSAELGERLLDTTTQEDRIALLTQFLLRRSDSAQPDDTLVADSLRLIHGQIRSIRVPHLLHALNLSERQFERRFLRAVGVSPHHYIRIMRFQEAVRLMKTRQFDRLSDIAYDLNYADQSHFIKDIKDFSGHTPKSLSQTVRCEEQLW